MAQQQRRKKRKKKSKSTILINIILVIAILCFAGSGFYLFRYFYTNYKAEQNVGELAEKIKVTSETVIETNEVGETQVLDGRYMDLYYENNDFIGWISIEGTQLNYPVMYTPEDNEFYLRRNFEKEYEDSGLPFVDARCTVQDPTQNIIIYGHYMKTGSMFACIHDYKDPEFLKEHPVIKFDTLYDSGEYEICYVILSRAFYEDEEGFRYYDFIQCEDEASFNETVAELDKLSVYDTGIDISMDDQLITLSTCEYSQDNGRMALVARKIN